MKRQTEKPAFMSPESWDDIQSGRRNRMEPDPPTGFRYCDEGLMVREEDWARHLERFHPDRVEASVVLISDRRARKRAAYIAAGLTGEGKPRKIRYAGRTRPELADKVAGQTG